MDQFVSTASGFLGILNVTYTSIKGLRGFIISIRDADDNLRDIKNNLNEVENLLVSLESEIQSHNATYSLHTREALESLGKVLKSCQSSCDEFRLKMARNLSPTADGTMPFWDKVKLGFHSNEVDSFKDMMLQQKGAIASFLGIANLQASTSNSNRLAELKQTIGVAIKDQDASLSQIEADIQAMMRCGQQQIIPILKKQKVVLEECRGACLKGLEATVATNGTTIRNATVHQRALQFLNAIGDVKPGGPTVAIDGMHAYDDAQSYGGPMSEDAVERILKSRPQFC